MYIIRWHGAWQKRTESLIFCLYWTRMSLVILPWNLHNLLNLSSLHFWVAHNKKTIPEKVLFIMHTIRKCNQFVKFELFCNNIHWNKTLNKKVSNKYNQNRMILGRDIAKSVVLQKIDFWTCIHFKLTYYANTLALLEKSWPKKMVHAQTLVYWSH